MTASQTQSLPDTERYTLEHDTLCRLAALAASCPRHWCRLRRCRRAGICLGALRPVEGAPALFLPPCVPSLDAPPAAAFRASVRSWADRLARCGMSAFDSPPRDG
ncbi:hypothetical protein MNR02_10995 [Shinella sp. H4-D48]|uniref:Uncharacterized protein n=1 Tax=Shinella sedimenti TaxID=2919913 RepID=A0ABT0CHC9_9HYPH|nr:MULTISPECIES: hypothetical protein [Shinella]MCJ8147993.1 hypothetical protein [Shinella sedimenti]UNK37011.1 hypothetical protein MNR02_10995 [Shinella sp. H4-D48]